jgi:hypothetical protein
MATVAKAAEPRRTAGAAYQQNNRGRHHLELEPGLTYFIFFAVKRLLAILALTASVTAQQSATLSVDTPLRQASSFNYNAFPIMMKAGNGTILDFYRAANTHASDNGSIMLRTSTDNGATWNLFAGRNHCAGGTPTGCLFSDAAYDSRSGAGGVAPDSSLVFLWFKYKTSNGQSQGVFYSRSTDNGATWSSPTQMTMTDKTFGWTSYSTIVTIPSGSNFPCASGCIATVVWDIPQSNLYLVLSTDNGQTWTATRTMNAATNEVSLIATGVNRIMGFARNCNGSSISSTCNLQITSTTDMGKTWTTAATNLTFTNPPNTTAQATCKVNFPSSPCTHNALTSWVLVSPWIIQSDSGDTLLFAERDVFDSEVPAFMYLRAVPFVPATAISNPTGFGPGQCLYSTTDDGSVNFGYETAVQQQDALHNLIQFYSENEPSTTNVLLFTQNSQRTITRVGAELKPRGGWWPWWR